MLQSACYSWRLDLLLPMQVRAHGTITTLAAGCGWQQGLDSFVQSL